MVPPGSGGSMIRGRLVSVIVGLQDGLGGAQLDPDGAVHGVPGGVHLDPGVADPGYLLATRM